MKTFELSRVAGWSFSLV